MDEEFYLQDIQAREDVVVLEETHHFELTKDAFRADQALEDIGQLFKSHSFSVSWIRDGPDHSKCSISNGTIWYTVTASSGPCNATNH